jgi:hypothetical protein
VLYQIINNARQKHDDGGSVNGMHYPQVKAGRPVGIFFSEKIHCSNILKSGFAFGDIQIYATAPVLFCFTLKISARIVTLL